MDRRKIKRGVPRRPAPSVKHERSAGGLVLRRDGEAYAGLLIGRSQPRIWSLPKGHVEAGESIDAAATREVEEETSIKAAIIDKLSDIRYWFYTRDVKHSKVVHFYLMRYLGGKAVPQVGEVDETRWIPLEEMAAVMTHRNERRLVEMARAMVSLRPAAELGFA